MFVGDVVKKFPYVVDLLFGTFNKEKNGVFNKFKLESLKVGVTTKTVLFNFHVVVKAVNTCMF